jgi:hypothetical protein
MEEAEREFKELTEGKYKHLIKSNKERDKESEDIDKLDGIWEADRLHLASIYKQK